MAIQTVTLSSANPEVEVEALLDEAGAMVTSGYGGWEIISRPRRLGVTHWAGRSPIQLSLALILDGHSKAEAVDSDCSRLETLALPHADAGGSTPIVRITNGGDTTSHRAVPYSSVQQWVIEDLSWGDTIRNKQGFRTRQHVVVGLLRYVAVDKIQVSAAVNARTKGTPGVRTVDVRQGDTLAKVAARYLGNSKFWGKVAALNPPLRDPNAIITLEKIKVPPKESD